ncbi:MAG: hypothetical protein ABIG30_01235 [Candidatus Aenigmatarchaeota archaeon]
MFWSRRSVQGNAERMQRASGYLNICHGSGIDTRYPVGYLFRPPNPLATLTAYAEMGRKFCLPRRWRCNDLDVHRHFKHKLKDFERSDEIAANDIKTGLEELDAAGILIPEEWTVLAEVPRIVSSIASSFSQGNETLLQFLKQHPEIFDKSILNGAYTEIGEPPLALSVKVRRFAGSLQTTYIATYNAYLPNIYVSEVSAQVGFALIPRKEVSGAPFEFVHGNVDITNNRETWKSAAIRSHRGSRFSIDFIECNSMQVSAEKLERYSPEHVGPMEDLEEVVAWLNQFVDKS